MVMPEGVVEVGPLAPAGPAPSPAVAPAVSGIPTSRRAARTAATAPLATPSLVTEEAREAESPATASPAASAFVADPFEAAARVFSFTGETPVVKTKDSPGESALPVDAMPAERRRLPLKRLTAASFSVGVMGVVGLMTLSMGAPAEAVAAATKAEAVTSIEAPAETGGDGAATEIQAYTAPDTADTDLSRDEKYTTTTFSEIAAATGITRHTNFFVNDPAAPIQWPFAAGVPISDGYGPRWGSFHYGLDFTPGEGAHIQSVAAGTVRVASESGGAFGVHVIIDHEIDGEVFSTHYAHMQYGSLQVKAGDVVPVGTFLGLTGNTGLSYGAHLHFEVFVGNQRIDPLAWLREHAGG
ncbi:M23 family metallopeptidase [Microbacterium limosum]|uniref:M23 family metallopeptidase n=1 Tax=Microbacterium limosum TaxID=3079935 RepID=A0AAU0MHY2_9MICO|nr:M23 family metallopeptidase [Microbacterium sp. Y20]WOQ70161.1 M23 family metallopeptidase [Microbacterium sp. Y20]